MIITRFICLFSVSMILAGCWAAAIPGEAPDSIGNADLLDSLIGQPIENTLGELGLPNELITDGDRQHMIYETRSSGTGVVFLVWIPILPTRTVEDSVLHCLRIEINSRNVVTDYQLESEATGMGVMGAEVELNANCREVFWNKKELTKLQMTTSFPSEWYEIVTQGNPDLQLALFKDLRRTKPEVALIWLCRSADSGNQEAIVILRNIYENGGYPWIKNGIVDADFRLAYVWFMQSGSDLPSQAYLASLTTEERLDAEKMLKEWQPGGCERELGLVGD